MPPCRSDTSLRRQVLLETLSLSARPAMRPCDKCQKRGIAGSCLVGERSDSCIACIRAGYKCDLAPFSPAQWLRLERQREQKSREAREALAKWSRLAAEVDELEKKKRELVEGEMRNIKDLESGSSSSGPSPNDFLLDVDSEKLVLQDDFDWGSLDFAPGGTVEEGTCNS